MTIRATVVAIAWAISLSAHAMADAPKQIDIPAGDLRQALLQLAEQSGADLVYQPKHVRGLRTSGVRGSLTPAQAVIKLLEGTPLQLRMDSSGAMLIARPPVSAPAPQEQGPGGGSSPRRPEDSKTGETATEQTSSSPSVGSDTADALDLGEIIVTGTRVSRTKFETSYAITTLSGEELARRAPLGIADLISSAPGLYVESSGGEVGNNVYSRGLPNDNFRYVPVLEDGLPVWEEGAGAFTNADIFYRVDSTIASAQIVRGGSASITASNAPGGVLNVVTRRGTEQFEGLVKYEGGDYDHYRGDFNVSGPVSDSVLFHAGGFYRADNGMRDPGFTGNRGGQFRAGLTFKLDDGELYVGYRNLNDRNIFYTAIPLASTSEGLPGLDAGNGTLVSNSFSSVLAPDGQGAFTHRVNLGDGVHTDVGSTTIQFDKDLTDWLTVNAKSRYTTGKVDFNGLFSNSVAGSQAYLDASLAQLVAARPDTVRDEYRDASSGAPIAAAAIGNQLALRESIFNTLVDLDNLIGDLSFTAELGPHKLTTGYYYSHFDQRQQWNWNDVLTEATNQPRLLDVLGIDAAGNATVSLTRRGLVGLHSNLQDFSDDVTVNAFYLTDSWQATDSLRIDVGARHHDVRKRGTIAQTTSRNLGDNATVADDSVAVFTGGTTPYAFDASEWAFSGGANYEFSQRIAAFARYSRSFRVTPEFSQWFNCCNPVEDKIELVEGGFKYSAPRFSAFVTLFYNNFPNISFNQIINGQVQTAKAAAESYGLEAEFIFRPVDSLDIAFTGSAQSIKYTGFSGVDANGAFDFSGNRIVRQPTYTASIRPTLHLGSGAFDIYANAQFTGSRFADVANTIELPSYTEVSLGANWAITSQLSAEFIATNLFDEVGLTEGNPRAGAIVGSTETAFQGRPIFGRHVRAGVAFRF